MLRKTGKKSGYEILKDLTRGKVITIDLLHEFIDNLDIDDKDKEKLKKLEIKEYKGLADKLVKQD